MGICGSVMLASSYLRPHVRSVLATALWLVLTNDYGIDLFFLAN
jgi:hypothetical protein